MRLWGGRFSGTTDERVAEFTRSVELDRALALDDLAVHFSVGSRLKGGVRQLASVTWSTDAGGKPDIMVRT